MGARGPNEAGAALQFSWAVMKSLYQQVGWGKATKQIMLSYLANNIPVLLCAEFLDEPVFAWLVEPGQKDDLMALFNASNLDWETSFNVTPYTKYAPLKFIFGRLHDALRRRLFFCCYSLGLAGIMTLTWPLGNRLPGSPWRL